MISMKDLFSRQGIDREVISLHHSLASHPDGLTIGLREAHRRLLKIADGEGGLSRGCRRPDSVKIDYGFGEKELGGVLPAWVPVSGNTRLVRDQRGGRTTIQLICDYTGETRAVEGILTKSKVTHTDFPFKPWHTYYDWNFFVLVDKQYRYLLSESNINDPPDRDRRGIMECEWDTAFLPSWAWPQTGNRVWIIGRWIFDCGHPSDHGYRTEIHPPKAVASFRSEAVKFASNSGPTQANNAVLYIGRNGGYWRQPINDQDYAFDLYLPPKPYAEAVPVWKVASKTGRLPVRVSITPYPADNPKALRIVIPLKGVNPHPDEYGAIISGGWRDPRGTESTKIKRVRVTVEKIFMDRNLDRFSGDEWYVYIGINGRWKVWQSIGGDSETLNYSVHLDLHPDDRIHITACGFEADPIHDLMGKNIGLSWAEISNPTQASHNAGKIRGGFLSLGGNLLEGGGIENDPIGLFSKRHRPSDRSTFTEASDVGDYRLRYRIQEVAPH